MIILQLHRSELVEKKACLDGLALFDAIKAHQDEARARAGKPVRKSLSVRWSHAAQVWSAVAYPAFTSWLIDVGLLQAANLYGADLRSANLRNANLRNANLGYSNLSGANIGGADLRNADLSGANIRNADLYCADLRNANLYGANLYGADLHNADLYGADLRNANLGGANLYGADLGCARSIPLVPITLPAGWERDEAGTIRQSKTVVP